MSSNEYISPSGHVGLSGWAAASGLKLEDAMDGPVQCGVDLVDIARIQAVAERWGARFLNRIWTERELLVCRGRYPELAVRFAAKEAVSKALGTGIVGIRWREIEIIPDRRGKPLVFLHGAARARAAFLGLDTWAVSLTHTGELACAFVVAQGNHNQWKVKS